MKARVAKRAKKRNGIIKRLACSKDPTDRLYAAVAEYVEAKEGNVMVIGGIQIHDEGKYKFKVLVNCCGTMPAYARTAKEARGHAK